MRTLVAAAACACHFWLLGGHLQTKHNVLITTHTAASFATTVGVVGSIHPASSSTALKPDECPRAGRPHRVHFPSMHAVRREGRGIRIPTPLHEPKAGAVSFSSWRARSALSGRAGKRQTSDEANLPCDASTTKEYPLPPRPRPRSRRGRIVVLAVAGESMRLVSPGR